MYKLLETSWKLTVLHFLFLTLVVFLPPSPLFSFFANNFWPYGSTFYIQSTSYLPLFPYQHPLHWSLLLALAVLLYSDVLLYIDFLFSIQSGSSFLYMTPHQILLFAVYFQMDMLCSFPIFSLLPYSASDFYPTLLLFPATPLLNKGGFLPLLTSS